MTKLLDHKAPRPRFARSINVERDSGSKAVDGYLPVGRAIDAINRLVSALDRDDAEVAISITGPYGSGKSSLAVVIDALLGPSSDAARASAEELLGHTAPESLERLRGVMERLGADRRGFIRSVVTAQREPISATIVRALIHGAQRFKPARGDAPKLNATVDELMALERSDVRPDARTLRSLVADLGAVAPVLLLIDEFGKNLEAFADSHSDSDLFLLQELAEWSRGSDGLPLAVVTMQHMAFDEYADAASAGQRREWAKIQGRFEDVPFVDSAAQTRALVAAAFGTPTDELSEAQERWATEEVTQLRTLGLNDLGATPETLAGCWPLHPLALAALPELCERYGQNERTLFSFLATMAPNTVGEFLSETDWKSGDELPVVCLYRLYDYFINAAANLAAISANASRWLEIDTRIRDAAGLTEQARAVLKCVGLLNLVSAGGTLRASPAMVAYAVRSGDISFVDVDVQALLDELEASGLITFRDFADEYRVWHGTDFDLRSAIDLARRRLRDEPDASILNRVLELQPLVAARHSHTTGTLRAFERAWVGPDVERIEPLSASDRPDGLVLHVLGPEAPTGVVQKAAQEKPVVFATTPDPSRLTEAVREVAAIDEVLASVDEIADDWVARRELTERRVEAHAELERSFHEAYSSIRAEWLVPLPGKRRRWKVVTAPSASGVVSEACEAWYDQAPVIRNDLVNRHDLSSQAAKARRMVLEAMVGNQELPHLGIDGSGPDHTLYLSLLLEHGLHRQLDGEGTWGFTDPDRKSPLWPVWSALNDLLAGAHTDRLQVDDIYTSLSSPPHGLRAGVAPVLLVAALLTSHEEIAVYEHGTFRPVLTDDVLERLLRNPDNFELKHYALRGGVRSEFLTRLADELGVAATRGPRSGRVGSVLAVVSSLVALVNTMPEYVRRTSHLSDDAVAVRRVLVAATEPDELLFHDIPAALGFERVPATTDYPLEALDSMAKKLRAVVDELRGAFPALLAEVHSALEQHVGPSCNPLREGLAARARELDGQIIDPSVAKLAVALTADIPDEESWLAYVAMNVAGEPPEAWTDDDRKRFFVSIADAGGTFRRIHALNADLEARGEDFDAFRHVLTRSDGAEVVHVQAVGASARLAGTPVAKEAVGRLASDLHVSVSEARIVLATLLLEADLQEHESLDIQQHDDFELEINRKAEG